MKNEEKIYQKIKNASNKTEETFFPGMDKVWNRVEEKLDTKIIKKKSDLWKKLAIAASFLLFFTVGIQLFNTQKELTEPIEPKMNIEPTTEKVQDNIENKLDEEKIETIEVSPEVETFVNTSDIQANTTEPKAIISESKDESHDDVPAIIKNDYKISESAKTSFAADEIKADVQLMSKKEAVDKGYYNSASSNNVFYPSKGKIYAARSSNMKYKKAEEKLSSSYVQTTKNDDLVLIDGKLSNKKREDLSSDEMEEMVELKNPIYIINGEEFSEESLFGEKPTSKYAPLTNQKIDSIKVYLPEEAKYIYGDKGKNGVVIISVKK
ncbi:hypothetical protein ACFO3U_06725 [Flavobacterium ponti]|uniref:TonB-dependent receptor plug domain-containing protein n=1 Tax=Flavobacterium ponti TaxID=665133 RepID=A0ABV9P4R3_9FLAO